MNKLLRRQLGSEPTTADSLNMEFRLNPDDDIEVIDTYHAQCNICNANIVEIGWVDDDIIARCSHCNAVR